MIVPYVISWTACAFSLWCAAATVIHSKAASWYRRAGRYQLHHPPRIVRVSKRIWP